MSYPLEHAGVEVLLVPSGDASSRLHRLLGGRPVGRDSNGKPVLSDGSRPHFNLSHSGDFALIALSPDAPVGIDLEAPRTLRAPHRLADRTCTRRELDHLAALAPEDFARGFLRLWVRKEAVAKCRGGGLKIVLDRVEVIDDNLPDGITLHDLPTPAPGYLAALAIACADATR